MQFVSVGGVTIHCLIEGAQDKLPLVFINSLGTDLRIWDDLTAHFRADFSIIRYDKRGHGLSDCPPGPYSLRDHANDLWRLLQQLHVSQAILLGISVGGMVALEFSACFPEQVMALVLSDTAARIGSAEGWNQRIELIRSKGMERAAPSILRVWFSRSFAKKRRADYQGYLNMLARMPAEGYIGTCAALRDGDLRDQAGAIKIRSLVLCGKQDSSTPPGLVSELAESLDNARFEVIEDAGHLLCIEQPDRMAAKIRAFFRETGLL